VSRSVLCCAVLLLLCVCVSVSVYVCVCLRVVLLLLFAVCVCESACGVCCYYVMLCGCFCVSVVCVLWNKNTYIEYFKTINIQYTNDAFKRRLVLLQSNVCNFNQPIENTRVSCLCQSISRS